MSAGAMIPPVCPSWCQNVHTPDAWRRDGFWLHEHTVLCSAFAEVLVSSLQQAGGPDLPATVEVSSQVIELTPGEARDLATRLGDALRRAADLVEGVDR